MRLSTSPSHAVGATLLSRCSPRFLMSIGWGMLCWKKKFLLLPTCKGLNISAAQCTFQYIPFNLGHKVRKRNGSFLSYFKCRGHIRGCLSLISFVSVKVSLPSASFIWSKRAVWDFFKRFITKVSSGEDEKWCKCASWWKRKTEKLSPLVLLEERVSLEPCSLKNCLEKPLYMKDKTENCSLKGWKGREHIWKPLPVNTFHHWIFKCKFQQREPHINRGSRNTAASSEPELSKVGLRRRGKPEKICTRHTELAHLWRRH